ncbi:MAG: ABC transporter transmembrane domain-containing protein, partial [Defluviitaleaceae bacterium]|nr:ABC transporter transmembrane domain-containing protein [Defluviitaleaceae bacterium]
MKGTIVNINSKKIIEIMKPALVEKKLNTVLKIFGIVSLWAIGLALPFVTGLYVDRLVTDANLDLILTFVVAFLVIYVVRTAIIGMRYVVDTTFNNLLWHRVETNPILHMFKSHFSKYQNEDAGELTGKLKFDGQTFAFLFSNTTSAFIEAITVVAVFVMLFFIDFYIAVIALVVSPIYLLFYIIFKKRLFAQGEIYAKDDALYQSRKNEQIYRMSFIRKHEVANETLARLEEAYHTRNRSEIKQNILSFGYRQSGGILGAFFHVAVIGFGGYRVISGELSIGMFTVISLYFNMIMGAFFELSNFGVNIQMAKVSTNRLNEIYENPQDLNGDKQLEHINELKLNNLSLVYGDNKVFSGLSYNFKAGKIYAICGENGSGKTSLLNCILGLYQDICTGEI